MVGASPTGDGRTTLFTSRFAGTLCFVAGAMGGNQLLSEDHAPDPLLASDLLKAKYRASRRADDAVCRTELLHRLGEARDRPLVLVVAPAGYGKTTLLAQWSERDGRPFTWITLDRADGDPAVLADSIATALRRIGITGSGFVLVLDGAEAVAPEVLADAITDVLGWLPEGSQVVLSSRCEPPLPLGQMRGRRMLLQLGARDLSMSAAEAASLLRKAGFELEFAAVQALVLRTEGWPVALELAALSLAGQSDPALSAVRFAGDHHLMADYFRAEIMSTLTPGSIRFLTRSSVLERLSGPLCDFVLERTLSAGLLAQLARANLPLEPVDPSHEWYRLHGLFRQMLQTELRRSEPEIQSALHQRAGYWHSRVGDVDQAIDHARSGGDLDRAGELLWGYLLRYLGEGRNDSVQRWLRGVTAEQAAGCPPLALAEAHSHLVLGNIALAEQWARAADVALSQEAARRTDPERAGVAIIEAWAGRLGATRMGEDAARAYELLPNDSPWRASCCLLRGTAALLAGEESEAERHLEEGAARGALLAPNAATLCLAQLAVLALEQNDAEIAGDLARRACAVIEERSLSGYPTSALVFAVSAAARVRLGRVDEAKAAGSRCAALIDMLDGFIPWYCAETRIVLARGLLALGDVAGARERLAEASRLARRTPGVAVFQRWFDDAWDQFDARAETALVGVASLTTAELRVLRFLPTHYSFHEIAERLHVSSNTVKTHVHAVYRKLDASSRSQAVANATHAGLLGC